MLEGVEVPPHCGIIEYNGEATYWGLATKRPAPTLRTPTKLDQAQIFNLALKAASRVSCQNRAR
jgi:hypothetical protein